MIEHQQFHVVSFNIYTVWSYFTVYLNFFYGFGKEMSNFSTTS